MRSTRTRITIFIARWALLSGLAGTVFAALVLTQARGASLSDTQRNLLLVAAILLSLAFVLAPIVRRAFAGPAISAPARPVRKTLLDEMREGEPGASPEPELADSPEPSRVAFRILVALYFLFGAVLIAILTKL